MPNIIEVEHLHTAFGTQVVHQDLSFAVEQGEIVAIVGGSGSGKTTLLNCLLMLLTPQSGTIKIFGQNVMQLSNQEKNLLRMKTAVLFQSGALFSELTVLQNTMFPMQQHSKLNQQDFIKLAQLKILMAGLPPKAAEKYPDELSGGMIKRASMARALALDPSLLFLDEPGSGLDPISANALDQLILELQQSLKLTIVMVTHDLDTLATVPDRIIFLGNGKILAHGDLNTLLASDDPMVHEYFHNARAQKAFQETSTCDQKN